MSVLALSPELLRQLASTLTARRVSGVSGPVFGYLLGSPSNAVLSEDQNDGYRTTAVAADAAGAVTAIGALMLPPGLADGRHIACGSFGSLASFATSVPDGVPFLGVVAIAPDVASSADGEEGSSSAAASAFGAALNEFPASKKASNLADTDFASFVDESVRGNLEYWSENLSILRGHPSTQPAGTELGASFPLLVVLPNAADALVPEAGEESKGSDIVYVTCDGPERINEACLRAFTVSPPSEEELDAAYAAAESKDVEGEEEAEAAAIKVSPLSLSTSTEYPSQASNWGVLRRSVTLRVPTVITAYNGALGAAAYLRSAITSNPSIACLLPPSAIAVAEGPSPPADIVVAAEAVKGVRVGGAIVAAEVQGIEPVLLSYKEQGPSMDAVFSVTPNESGIVDVIVYPSTAAAAPPAGSVIGTAVAAPGASTFPLTTTPLAHREPLTVTLTAFSCLPCVSQGQSKPITLARAVSRLHRCLQDQLSLICGLFESSPLLLHQSGLLLGGNGSRSGCASGRGWPALALAPAAVPAKGMSLLGDKPADGNSSAAPPLMHNEPLRPAMANLLAKLLSPFLPRLPTPYASQVAQAAHPSVLVPTSIDVVPVAPASLWRIPLLAVVPRFQYDSAAAEAAAASGAGESFGTAAAAAVAAEQSAALSAVATALVPSGGSILPSPNAEGLPLTSAEAADEIRRSLLPPPVEGVSLLPAGAVVRAAREAPLRAALTWRFGALTSEQPLRLVGSDPIEEDDLGAGRLVGVHARAPLPESFVSGQQQGKKGPSSSLSLDGDRITVALSTGKSEFCHYGPLPASSFSTSGASSSLSSSSSTDKGWGCAYRSLQTIVSWFRLNHALTPSSHPHLRGPMSLPAGSPAAAACVGVPSHVAIQTALVALGDKPASLRGSAQWVGAVELALVLQGLYGLRARLVSVASGDGVRSHARELVKHFQEQGSPVMVGGGELALTVMGVAINEESGDVRYLIMDPHYTGEDDAEVVVGTGRGCVWRGDEVWDRNAFYNILLPQRPTARVDL